MASIDVTEIFSLLQERGHRDASPFDPLGSGFFLEITFDQFKHEFTPEVADEELANRVITADCQYGLATILFDAFGRLSKIEIC